MLYVCIRDNEIIDMITLTSEPYLVKYVNLKILGGNSQNFLQKFVIFLATLRCLNGFIENQYFITFTVVKINFY